MPALNRSYNWGGGLLDWCSHTDMLQTCVLYRHTWTTCLSILFSVILWSFMADFPFQLNQFLGTVPHVSPNRDGGFDEESGGHECGAHSGGEEPTISGLQECDWGPESLLEDNQQY